MVATASWEGINTISALPGSRRNQPKQMPNQKEQPPGPPKAGRRAWGLKPFQAKNVSPQARQKLDGEPGG